MRTVVPTLALTLLALTGCADDDVATDPAFDAPIESSTAPARPKATSATPGESATTEESTRSGAPTTSGSPDASDNPVDQGALLLQGWPSAEEVGSDGRVKGPGPGANTIRFKACGREFALDVDDRLDAALEAPEDFRARSIGRYPDESEARAATDRLESMFRRCKDDPADPTWLTLVSGDASGEEGLRVTQSVSAGDSVGVGVAAHVIFLRGSTMVISTQSNEGAGQAEARRQARTQARQLQPVLTTVG